MGRGLRHDGAHLVHAHPRLVGEVRRVSQYVQVVSKHTVTPHLCVTAFRWVLHLIAQRPIPHTFPAYALLRHDGTDATVVTAHLYISGLRLRH